MEDRAGLIGGAAMDRKGGGPTVEAEGEARKEVGDMGGDCNLSV